MAGSNFLIIHLFTRTVSNAACSTNLHTRGAQELFAETVAATVLSRDGAVARGLDLGCVNGLVEVGVELLADCFEWLGSGLCERGVEAVQRSAQSVEQSVFRADAFRRLDRAPEVIDDRQER